MSGQQPGWSAPSQPYPPAPPQPRRPSAGKNLGIGCLGFFALIVLIAVTSVVISGGGGKGDSADRAPVARQTEGAADAEEADEPKVKKEPDAKKDPAAQEKAAKPEARKEQPPKVVFKVWGAAPAGVDITYGSDSENIQGGSLPMPKSLKLKDDALYYAVTAQLQGGGDVHCSVTVDGQTKKGHASGGYNICNAQLSGDMFGGWR